MIAHYYKKQDSITVTDIEYNRKKDVPDSGKATEDEDTKQSKPSQGYSRPQQNNDRPSLRSPTCFNCGKKGHKAMECKEKRKIPTLPVKFGRLSILDSPPDRLMMEKVRHYDATLLLDTRAICGAARSVVSTNGEKVGIHRQDPYSYRSQQRVKTTICKSMDHSKKL